MSVLQQQAKAARAAFKHLARSSTEQRNLALANIAELLIQNSAEILLANEKDIAQARANGLAESLIDRLLLNQTRIDAIANDVRAVIALADPIAEIIEQQVLENGLHLRKQRVPLGVLGVIFEARPNVTIDIACLALKSANAVILRGGKETLHSNRALVKVLQNALQGANISSDAVQFVDSESRQALQELLSLDHYVDLIIPRGGAGLHAFCREHSRIPVITGGIGICHLFVDASADIERSIAVIENAKVQRPSVCNALDTVLLHSEIAPAILPLLLQRLSHQGVSFRATDAALKLLDQDFALIHGVQLADENDFDTEWLSLILGVEIVDSLDYAMEFIAAHSSGHSDGILTQSTANAERFIAEVDSAAVYVNASTRFTDGAQMGLGAEVAVSTQRVHARGPMGLRELCTYKWVGQGDYHTRK